MTKYSIPTFIVWDYNFLVNMGRETTFFQGIIGVKPKHTLKKLRKNYIKKNTEFDHRNNESYTFNCNKLNLINLIC